MAAKQRATSASPHKVFSAFVFPVVLSCAAAPAYSDPVAERQRAIDILHQSLETLWDKRVEMTLDGVPYVGFATRMSMDDGIPFWGDEVGALSDLPLWDFQNGFGTPGVLFVFLEAYRATGNVAYLRRAESLADTLLVCQDALDGGWFYDMSVVNNQLRNVGVWGSWGARLHDPADLQGWFTLDDSISQSCAHALLRLYQTNGDARILNAARRFADEIVNLKYLSHQGVLPYVDGGIPQVLPIARALETAYNENQDGRSPHGPYMAHKTLNDDTTSSALIFLIELFAETNDARYRDAVRLNIDYLIDRFDEHGASGWAQQYHVFTDEIAWGRGKEPPSFVTCENHIVEVFLHWYRNENDAGRRGDMERVLEAYMNWLAGLTTPAGHPDHTWRYYNHEASAAPLDEVVFGREFRRYFGDANEGNAGSGQTYHGKWDGRWIERLRDNDGDFALRFDEYFMWKIPDRPLALLPESWEPTAERPLAIWISGVEMDGETRDALIVSTTNARLLDLAWRVPELPGTVTDSDADGVSDSDEQIAQSDPWDSDDFPTTLRDGDMNCDDQVTVGDLSGFLEALLDPSHYQDLYPGCDIAAADANHDGVISVSDIGPFVAALLGDED
ncbi:MAG: pectate lyase [Phycisphaerae bacterium]